MKKHLAILAILAMTVMSAPASPGEVSLDYCLDKACENYPLIAKYGLVEKTADISLADINRGWLPRIEAYGQTTVQNVVPEFPQSLKDVLAQLGQKSDGLGHVQYKLGVDVSQTIWDGGMSKARRDIECASSAEQQAQLDVRMYGIREKVMNLYFGILLAEAQISQTENTLGLLASNLKLMKSMYAGGVAMQSDVDMVEAQSLSMKQLLAQARSAVRAYRDVLSLYVGENLADSPLARPEASVPEGSESARPELALFDAQSRLNDARHSLTECSLMPRFGFFAQAWYGYPGINYFESMMKRDLSFNVLAGVKVSWNIDSFYTRKSSRRKTELAGESIANDRDVFLYNTKLKTSAQRQEIEGLRTVMADDARIIALRGNVRRAAESQLANGVIDATALLSKITDENSACLTASYHEILLIQKIYELKYNLNR